MPTRTHHPVAVPAIRAARFLARAARTLSIKRVGIKKALSTRQKTQRAQAIATCRNYDSLLTTAEAELESIAEAALKEVDTSAATLAMANRTTDHILTAETPAIGDLEKKQKLRLVPRPGRSPIGRSRRAL